MSHIIQTVQAHGKTIQISIDEDPMHPRKEYDNLGTIAHWHRRYDLGEQIEPCTEAELRELVGEKILAVLPVYMYDHSGVTLSVAPFGCRFDSGQVGWIYCTESSAKAMGYEYRAPEVLTESLKGEIQTYAAFLEGNVYCYQITGLDGETLGACGGFFDLDQCIDDATGEALYCEDPAVLRVAEELESRATYATI